MKYSKGEVIPPQNHPHTNSPYGWKLVEIIRQPISPEAGKRDRNVVFRNPHDSNSRLCLVVNAIELSPFVHSINNLARGHYEEKSGTVPGKDFCGTPACLERHQPCQATGHGEAVSVNAHTTGIDEMHLDIGQVHRCQVFTASTCRDGSQYDSFASATSILN